MSKTLTEATVLETGEKVIAGSVRPDGTVRKERRIRAGYIPQDEQPVYQSRGTLAKQNVPTCPGMDEAEIAALKQQAAKGKKSSGAPSQTPKATSSASSAAPKASNAAAAKQPAAAGAAAASAAAAAAPPPSEPEDPKAALEKQIRNLKKKIRQCTELAEKKQSGAALDQDQEEKLAKGVAWEEEVRRLEADLAKLGL